MLPSFVSAPFPLFAAADRTVAERPDTVGSTQRAWFRWGFLRSEDKSMNNKTFGFTFITHGLGRCSDGLGLRMEFIGPPVVCGWVGLLFGWG